MVETVVQVAVVVVLELLQLAELAQQIKDSLAQTTQVALFSKAVAVAVRE
jgi:hypothetical protein